MAYSAMAVANAFIKRAKDGLINDLTPMKLQKMIYFAQGWYLAYYQENLIDDFFVRWKYGPVVTSLYHEFKEYGAQPISGYGGHIIEENGLYVHKRPIVNKDDVDAWGVIDEIIRVYGKFSGVELSVMTHRQGSAWALKEEGTVITEGDYSQSNEFQLEES